MDEATEALSEQPRLGLALGKAVMDDGAPPPAFGKIRSATPPPLTLTTAKACETHNVAPGQPVEQRTAHRLSGRS